MPVNIKGKEYLTVAERINDFRSKLPDWSIETDIISNADVVIIKAFVKNNEGRTIGTGYAEEVRGSSMINKTSALENCETSAIGRALAACGYGGDQYASANEVSNAIIQQQVNDSLERHVRFGKALQENWDSVNFIKEHLASGDLDAAAEAFAEISEDDRQALSLARTKGGCWIKEEVDIMTSDEWKAIRAAQYS